MICLNLHSSAAARPPSTRRGLDLEFVGLALGRRRAGRNNIRAAWALEPHKAYRMGKPRWLFSAGCRRSTRTIEAADPTLDDLTALGAKTRQSNATQCDLGGSSGERGLARAPLLVASEVFGLQRLVGHPNGLNWTTKCSRRQADHAAKSALIERWADLDGGNRRVIVPQGISHTPKQIHLDKDSSKLYWCDREGMRVMRANLDGSHVETLVETGSFRTVLVPRGASKPEWLAR